MSNKKNKTVVSIVDYYQHAKTTGVNTYKDTLIEYFDNQKSSIDFNVIYLEAPLDHFEKHEGVNYFSFSKVRGDQSKGKSKKRYWANSIISKLTAEYGLSASCFIFHFNWIEHYSLATLLKVSMDCQTLLTVHYIPWKNLVSTNYKDFHSLHVMSSSGHYVSDRTVKFERKNYHVFDHIIVVTNSAKKNLVDFFKISTHKISLIYNGKYAKQAEESSLALRKKLFIDEDEVVILHLGAINKRKGVTELIKCFDELVQNGHRNIRLILAGAGQIDTFLTDSLMSFAKITWMGFQSEERINQLIKIADIGVLLSYTEQCSYAVIEMMSQGLPMVVTDVDGLKEMVEDGYNGALIEIDFAEDKVNINKEQLSLSLQSLISDSDKRKYFGENSLKKYHQYFTVDQMMSETIEVYNSVAHSSLQKSISHLNILLPFSGQKEILSDLDQEIITSLTNDPYKHKSLHFFAKESSFIKISEQLSDVINKRVAYYVHTFEDASSLNKKLFNVMSKFDDNSLTTINLLNGIGNQDRYSILCDRITSSSKMDFITSPYFIINDEYEVLYRQSYPDQFNAKILNYCQLFNKAATISNVIFKTKYLKIHKSKFMNLDLILWSKLFRINKSNTISNYSFYVFNRFHNNYINSFNRSSLEAIIKELSEFTQKYKIDISEEDIKIHIALNYNIFGEKRDKKTRQNYLAKINVLPHEQKWILEEIVLQK